MPQPLSRVTRGPYDITFSPDVALQRSEIATLIAQAISIWALVELSLGRTLVIMLGAKAIPAVAMYTALSSSVAQIAALKAAAEQVLDKAHNEVFEALMSIYRSAAKQRNKFSHWIWATCASAPNHLILFDPTTSVKTDAVISTMRRDPTEWLGKFEILDLQNLECYSIDDINKTVSEFTKILDHFTMFERLINPQHRTAPEQEIYQLLIKQPLIATALLRQRARQKTSPGGF